MSTAAERRIDPITFEVLRHKLDEIVAEAYHTIGRVSGSPVVYESGDHQEAICTATGELAAFGAGVMHWVRSISAGVTHVAERYRENPGFEDGDQFLLNDSYLASVHASDVQLLAPIFVEDRLIAWAGTASHQLDIGGVNPGGHHLEATERFAEGFQTPGLKLVERGRIRRDVEDTFANMVRSPEIGLLDIRAKIAANNVLRDRLLALVDRYGVETILTLFDQLIEYSDGRLRSKLRSLPDGTWTASNFVEGIGEPRLGVTVAITKSGETLEFDFSGSSPQSAGPENIAPTGAMSCAVDPMIAMLGHDLPWNHGLFGPIEFVLPEGSIVNPVAPAPISANVPSGASVLVLTACESALSKMLLDSDDLREEAAANTGGAYNFPVFAGLHRDGSPFTTLILDGLAGGGGALCDGDGDDSGHNLFSVKNMIANVESNEMLFPFLVLWRGEVTDSAGAGRFRGGVGLSEAIIPWQTEQLVLIAVGAGSTVRSTLGVAGGYPASNTPIWIARGAELPSRWFGRGRLPDRDEEIGGEVELLPSKTVTAIGAGDLLVTQVSAGGGGLGDPLTREPLAVADDVRLGRVSPEMAARLYGVVIGDGGEVDEEASERRRDEVRAERLRKAATR